MVATAQFSHMEGGAELAAVFRELPDQLARNSLASTARAGAQALQRAAYAQLSLYMRRSAREDDVVIKKERTPNEPISVSYAVGPPKRKPWLRWLHDGTAPHTITANSIKYAGGVKRPPRLRGKSLGKILASAATIFGPLVNHPGQPPRPWLFAAQWGSERAVLEAMAAQVRRALPAQAKRLVSSKFRNQQLRKWLR